MKRFRFLLALVAMLVLLAACGGGEGTGDPTEPVPGDTGATEPITPTEDTEPAPDLTLVQEGTLTICTDAPYPPMEFEDPETGEFTGFDIELLRAVAGELGLETSVINAGFDPITTGSAFAAGQCDIAAASITITEEREESIDFTEPYFDADQSLLVKTDSGIASLDDLANQVIGVQSGTTGEAYANDNKPEGAEVKAFENPGDIFVALEAGEINGVLQDLVVNQGRVVEDDSVAVVETYPTDEQYGFAVEQGNTALLDAVNNALATLTDNGTYDQIYAEWFPES